MDKISFNEFAEIIYGIFYIICLIGWFVEKDDTKANGFLLWAIIFKLSEMFLHM